MNKKIILFLLAGFLCTAKIFGQTNPERVLAEEYLKQSEKQKKTGLIMLGSGIGATILGTAMFGAAWGSGSEFLGAAGVTLLTAGTISTLVSIPVIVSSASKGKKAGKLSLVAANASQATSSGISLGYYPALSFSLPLTQTR
jgi:hypothetical protein